MDILEEKKYIYDMMRDITSERRELTKIYYDLKSRLDDLIILETKGLDRTSIKGIVDLHNSRELQQIATNIERETMGIIRKVEREPESKVEASGALEETLTPKIDDSPNGQEFVIQKETVENNENPKDEQLIQKRKFNKTGTTSIDKATGVIAHILKEYGMPIKSKDLYELVCDQLDTPIKRANFSNNILPRASKINRKINNVSHGYWQYLNN